MYIVQNYIYQKKRNPCSHSESLNLQEDVPGRDSFLQRHPRIGKLIFWHLWKKSFSVQRPNDENHEVWRRRGRGGDQSNLLTGNPIKLKKKIVTSSFLLKSSQGTSSSSVTWELARDAVSWASPQTC